ncbi:MAG: hypothetical protein ACPGPS_21965, partial [Rubripirellula sp.]
MKSFNILASITVLLLLCTPAISNDKDEKAQVKEKAQAKAETSGQVVIEINGVPQVIKLDSSPAVLKKQLKIIADDISKNGDSAKNPSK